MSEFWKRKIRTFFRTIDFDKDGFISEADFVGMARRFAEVYGANDERKENLIRMFVIVWKKFLKSSDIDEDNHLTAEILIESVKQQMYDPGFIIEYNHLIRGVHSLMDANEDGYLQPDEYHCLFKNLGFPEGNFDEKSAFDAIDVNGDGKLSIDEFIAAFFDFLFSQDENSPNRFFFGPLID